MSTRSRPIPLEYTPDGIIEAYAVRTGDSEMQVNLYLRAGWLSASLYLTATEARAAAAALTHAADEYEAWRAQEAAA